MHKLTPQFLFDQLEQGAHQGQFDAVVLFVDTSGFTPLTVQLSEQGREGTEVLAAILLAVFEPLVEAVYAHGGFITGFAGDAFKAVFPGLTAETYRHALAAAEAILAHMARNPTHATRYGRFDFRVRTSIADGPVTWAIWSADREGLAQSSGYTFAGSAIDAALVGEDHADGGELVMTDACYQALLALAPEYGVGEPLAGDAHGYVRIGAITATLPAPLSLPAADEPALTAASRFYPAALLTTLTLGEFRPVYTLFLNVARLPEPGAEDDFLPRFFALLHQYGGYLCRLGRIGANDPGGTFLLFWGAPTSHENDLERVLAFVLALQQELTIPLRAGITHSVVYAGFIGSPLREEYTCYGTSVNQAARQMGVAAWGQILLDAATLGRRMNSFDFTSIGPVALKGLTEARELWLLQGRRIQATTVVDNHLFIGRQRERLQIQRALRPIRAESFGGIVLIAGEAGIGKSRLIREVLSGEQWLNASPHPQIFICQADEILRESLNPFRYFLRRYFAQSPELDETTKRTNFTTKLAALTADPAVATLAAELERTRSFLAALINLRWDDSLYEQLEPQLRFANTLSALKTLLLAESLRQPVVLLLEDAHWLDEDSAAFLAQLTRNVEHYPFVILATARPITDAAPFARVAVTQELHLPPLSTTEVGDLVQSHLDGPIPPALSKLLVARAEGNPFFAEQLVLYLREEGLLKEDDRKWKREYAPAAVEQILPGDLQTVLVARLDRLTHEVKEIVQNAAVLGREFDVELLSQMLREDRALTDKVQLAADAAIWYALTALRYLFRHALLRDAAYTMQLRSRLRRLHALAAAAIETVHRTQIAPFYADLAYHYRSAEATAKECHYVELAGIQAAEQFANDEAITYLGRALELLPPTAIEQRYRVHQVLAEVYQVTGQIALQHHELTILQRLATELADVTRQAETAMRWAAYAELRADYQEAIHVVQQAIALAPGEQRLQAQAYRQWGVALANQGHYDAAQQQLAHALTIARAAQLENEEANCLFHLGLIWHYQGNYPRAHDHLEAALAIFRQRNALIETGNVLNALGMVANKLDDYAEKRYFEEALTMWQAAGYLKGQGTIYSGLGNVALAAGAYGTAQRYYEQTRQIALETGDRLLEGKMHFCLGLVGQRSGAHDSALARLQEALAIYRAIGHRQGEGAALSGLGNVYLNQERFAVAHRHLAEAIQIGEELNNRAELGDRLTTLGYILYKLGELAGARDACHRSLRIREELGQESLALVPHVYLAAIALAASDLAEAQRLIDLVLHALAEQTVDRIYDPPRFYYCCYQVLAALQDGRAAEMLRLAHDLLQERAARFTNADERAIYLAAISDHREIMRTYVDDSPR